MARWSANLEDRRKPPYAGIAMLLDHWKYGELMLLISAVQNAYLELVWDNACLQYNADQVGFYYLESRFSTCLIIANFLSSIFNCESKKTFSRSSQD